MITNSQFRSIREKLGLTQEELGVIVDRTQGCIAQYEAGTTVPPSVAKGVIDYAKEKGHELTFNDFYSEE